MNVIPRSCTRAMTKTARTAACWRRTLQRTAHPPSSAAVTGRDHTLSGSSTSPALLKEDESPPRTADGAVCTQERRARPASARDRPGDSALRDHATKARA